jgi:hypothetical protein
VTFPDVDWGAWRLRHETHYEADEHNDHAHTFQIWEPVATNNR